MIGCYDYGTSNARSRTPAARLRDMYRIAHRSATVLNRIHNRLQYAGNYTSFSSKGAIRYA